MPSKTDVHLSKESLIQKKENINGNKLQDYRAIALIVRRQMAKNDFR